MGSDESEDTIEVIPTGDDAPKFGDLAVFSKAGLRVIDDGLLKRLNRPALSPSTSKSMHGCTAKWVGGRVLQRPDLFAANSLGTDAHTIFERLFARPAHSRTYRDALGLILGLAEERFSTTDPLSLGLEAGLSKDAMLAIRADWQAEVTERVKPLWEIEDPSTVVAKDMEYAIGPDTDREVELGGVPFVGIIDRIDEVEVDGHRRMKPKDYKAGKSAIPDANKIKRYGDDHGDQLRLYYAALAELTGKAPAGAEVYYTFHGKKKKVAVAKNRVNATIRDFKQSWETLQTAVETATFPVEPGPLCGWCDLVNVCPAAQATGKVDRTGKAPQPVDLGLHIPVLALAPVPDGGVVHLSPATPPPSPVGSAPAAQPVVAAGALDGGTDSPDAVEDAGAGVATPPSPHTTDSDDGSASRLPGSNDIENELADLTGPAAADTDLTNLEGDDLMNAVRYAAREPKPWEGSPSDGTVNGNAYSSMAAFGTLELATDLLTERNLPLARRQIMALTWTLLAVVGDAQRRLAGREDMDAGLHTRLRGALRTTISTMPPPLPENEVAEWPTIEQWQEWVAGATRRVVAFAEMAHEVLTSPRPDAPYAALVEQPVAEASVTPLRAVPDAPEQPAETSAPAEPVAEQAPAQPVAQPVAQAAQPQVFSQPISEPAPAYSPAHDFPL